MVGWTLHFSKNSGQISPSDYLSIVRYMTEYWDDLEPNYSNIQIIWTIRSNSGTYIVGTWVSLMTESFTDHGHTYIKISHVSLCLKSEPTLREDIKKTVNFRTIINKGRGVGSEFFRTNFFAIVTFSVCHYFPPWFFYFQPFSIFKVFIVILIFFLVFFPNLLKKGLQFL